MILKKRGEWYARDWLIALVFFSLIIVLMNLAVVDTFTSYGKDNLIDSSFGASHDRFQNSTTEINQIFTRLSGAGGLSAQDFGQLIFQSGFSFTRMILGSLEIFNSQVSSIFIYIGVPSIISNYILTAVMAIIAITLIAIIVTNTSRNKI